MALQSGSGLTIKSGAIAQVEGAGRAYPEGSHDPAEQRNATDCDSRQRRRQRCDRERQRDDPGRVTASRSNQIRTNDQLATSIVTETAAQSASAVPRRQVTRRRRRKSLMLAPARQRKIS